MPKVFNGFSWTFVCKMGVGPRTKLYNICGDPLTQLLLVFLFFCFFSDWHSQKMNGKKILVVTHRPTYAINWTLIELVYTPLLSRYIIIWDYECLHVRYNLQNRNWNILCMYNITKHFSLSMPVCMLTAIYLYVIVFMRVHYIALYVVV